MRIITRFWFDHPEILLVYTTSPTQSHDNPHDHRQKQKAETNDGNDSHSIRRAPAENNDGGKAKAECRHGEKDGPFD